jgi:RNA polymerase sporulation-specific sigma factor
MKSEKSRIRNTIIGRLKNLLKKIKLRFHPQLVMYINGPETLPPPLSPLEEEQAVGEKENGNRKAREKLIVHNLRLVVYIAKKFETSGIGIEDLISIGTIGLIKAVNTFCPDKKIKLATYASRCIENEILMQLRKTSPMRNEVSLDEPLNTDYDGNELLLSDILGSENDIIYAELEHGDDIKTIIKIVSKLHQREKVIMEMRFGINGHKEHTQKEVADILGISQSYISRLEKKIIDKMKCEMERV